MTYRCCYSSLTGSASNFRDAS